MINRIISNPFAANVKRGKQCPYCGNATVKVGATHIYGSNTIFKGKYFQCVPCEAYVGTHNNPKGHNHGWSYGSVAKSNLRILRSDTHRYFDALWKNTSMEGRKGFKKGNRHQAYTWLSDNLGISYRNCHIGFFDENLCYSAIGLCSFHCKRFNISV